MKRNLPIIIGILFIYFLLHVSYLTKVPVFADEAIYIRWAQLIISDSKQYLFFALNDGKTPLYIWLLIPFLNFFSDPLFGARLLSVLIGALQIIAAMYATRLISNKQSIVLIGSLIAILPFWSMYHRFALMDSLLTLCATVSIIGILLLIEQFNKSKAKNAFKNIVFSKNNILPISTLAISFALALYTKLPAVLLLPSLGSLAVLLYAKKKNLIAFLFSLGMSFVIALSLFAILALHPAFPQLFSRGSDFLYTISDLPIINIVQVFVDNCIFVLDTFHQYISLPLLFILVFTPILRKDKVSGIFLISGLVFILPLLFLARVLHSRYLLPSLPFFTISLALSLEYVYEKCKTTIQLKNFNQFVPILIILLLFVIPAWKTYNFILDPEKVTLTADDKLQYFTDWSSGHGIKEVTDLLIETNKNTTLAVATEGYFGTLPDGILMYTFNSDVTNLYIEGIGQPVHEIRGKYLDNAYSYNQRWLIVNNFRMLLNLPKDTLIAEYCRPQKPDSCLQVWDITTHINK